MKSQLARHAKSAALTFSAIFLMQIYVLTENLESWDQLTVAVFSSAALSGARAMLKILVEASVRAVEKGG